MEQNRKNIIKKHVAPKLITRLRLFIFIILVIIGIVFYKTIINEVSPQYVLIGIIVGILAGFAVGMMSKIIWHEETKKVVSQMDIVGGIGLVLYIAVELGRTWFFGHWLTGTTLHIVSLACVAGLLIGRVLSMISQIKAVLKQEKSIKI